jgi:predicted permease
VRSLGDLAASAYYRLLLLAYPREFRSLDGNEAAVVFVEACRESRARGGLSAVVRRLANASVEVPRRGLNERLRHARGPVSPQPRRPRRRRAVTLLAELAADLRFAARSLRRRPGWTAAIAATLALGIGANTAIFSVVDATLLQSSPWPHADRLAHLGLRLTDSEVSLGGAPLQDMQRWVSRIDGIERFEAVEHRPAVLSHDSGARRVAVERVTTGYLDALGVRPLIGRFPGLGDTDADATAVVAMPEALWRRLYGADPDVVGQTVALDGVAYVVVGIVPEVEGVPEAFYGPMPVAGPEARELLAGGMVWLRPGASLEDVQVQLAALSTGENERWGSYVGTLTPDINIFWEMDDFRSALLGLQLAVFLVLAIACVNVANLLLAAAGTRRGELALRAALGAGRGRLVRFLLGESLILSALGGALGLFVAYTCMSVMRAMAPAGQLGDALEQVRIDGTVLGYAVLVVALAALVFGLLPALRAVAEGQRGALQESDARATGGRSRLRGAMVALETALSLVLLVAAGLTMRSFVELRFADPGFHADRILSAWITLPEARYPTDAAKEAFFDALRAQAAALPDIEDVALGMGAVPPSDYATGGAMTIEGREEPVETFMTVSMVEGGFLEFMGIPLLAGRDLTDEDVHDSTTVAEQPVVINRSLARRYWPDGDALGSLFRLSLDHDQRWNRVVGIAADVRQRGLEVPPDMLHYYRPLGVDRRAMQIVMRTRAGAAPPIRQVRQLVNRLDSQIATDELEAAAAGMLDSMSNTRFRALLFGGFGVVAVLLAALGIFGVVAYTVVQRTSEMGIRLALGAAPRDVRRLMLVAGSVPVLTGVAVGLPIALAVTRLMSGFLIGVPTTDPITYAGTAVLLVAVGTLAIWFPARRATKVDPVMTLRRG